MVDALAAERGYKNRDEVTVSPATMGDAYESKVKMFFAEHLHEDEEIRYIRDGEGYFDVRDREDEWVRIRLAKDDLIVLPAGIYHRFTTDDKNVSLSFFLSFFFVCSILSIFRIWMLDLELVVDFCAVRQGYASLPGRAQVDAA